MSWIEQTHKENISTLEKRIASMDAVNAAIAGSLKAQVVAMNQEHQRTTTALQNQIHSINESHRSSVSMLEGKISSSNAAISSMSRSHQTKVSNLKGQLSHSATSLQQAEQVIRQEQQRNANNVAEINNLRNERARAQREMANLRQAINDLDDDDGFCVIA
jgi:chromosome segregation ATPase